MPPNQPCPACGRMVPDWHFEWHSEEDQRAIFAGRAAMVCPWCSAAVACDGLDVSAAQASLVLVHRELAKAVQWTRNRGDVLSKDAESEIGEPYMRHWSETEIHAAEQG